MRRPDFGPALSRWLRGAQRLIDEHYAKDFPDLQVPKLETMAGPKRVRIVRTETAEGRVISRSAHAFIDIETGDVLKPASWKAPAKHARGNIFDESGGLKYMDSYGPAYLR